MEEIEVGEFVRTKEYGDIGKLLKITSTKAYLDSIGYAIDRKEIVKHSKNIIDLIKIEDIVKVKDHDWIRIFNIDDEDILNSFIEDCNENNWRLLSIVTKEQFASMEYKLED